MNLTILLADYAQRDKGNKLNAIGVGWGRVTSPLSVHSIVIVVDVDDSEIDITHDLNLQLVNQDGDVVADPGGGLIEANAKVRVQIDEGAKVAGPSVAALTLAPGLALPPGIYAWEARSPSAPERVWKRLFEVFEESASIAGQSTVAG